jgi:O-6-methylguanine DNA methyltransferase
MAMLVADLLQNPTTSSRAKPLLTHSPGPRHPEFRMALIPTAWGLSAAAWVIPPDDAAHRFTFSQKPAAALLSRIVTPGLPCQEIRTQLMRHYPGCHEVLGDGHGSFHPEVVPDWFPELVRYLQHYYASGLREWTEPEFVDHWTFWRPRLSWSDVTPFQRKVLETIACIPAGQKCTYGDIARKLGTPRAARAVGAALGSNPWPVLVPCHRVLGAGGKMTGFSAPGGVSTKQRMLHHETPTLFS